MVCCLPEMQIELCVLYLCFKYFMGHSYTEKLSLIYLNFDLDRSPVFPIWQDNHIHVWMCMKETGLVGLPQPCHRRRESPSGKGGASQPGVPGRPQSVPLLASPFLLFPTRSPLHSMEIPLPDPGPCPSVLLSLTQGHSVQCSQSSRARTQA